jgi:hypothetical protein
MTYKLFQLHQGQQVEHPLETSDKLHSACGLNAARWMGKTLDFHTLMAMVS